MEPTAYLIWYHILFGTRASPSVEWYVVPSLGCMETIEKIASTFKTCPSQVLGSLSSLSEEAFGFESFSKSKS